MMILDNTLYRWLSLTTLLLGVLVFWWGLGDIALMSFNEARRAIPASVMFQSGDWLLPRLNGELYLTKPPLLYWLAAACAHLFGEASEWAVRLPSALAASVIVWACCRYALRAFGAWPALFTAQVLIANAGFAVFARRAEIEMLLTALCAGALLAAWHYVRGDGGRGWLRLSYFLLGLAVLTKGPLALLFVTLPLLVYALYERTPRAWGALRDPLSWAIFWVVGLSWYAVVTWQLGFDTWVATVNKDMVGKIQGAAGEPFYNYFLWLLADFFPASLLIFASPLATLRRWRLNPDVVILLIAVVVPVVIYTLFSDKHAKYLLPIYPLLALLLGLRLGELISNSGPIVRRVVVGMGIMLPAAYALFFAFAEARVFDYRVAAFPRFAQWMRTSPDVPIYGYKDIDERLMYYARREVPLLDRAALRTLQAEGAAGLVLAENSRIQEVVPLTDCQLASFTPYLKKNKTLAVFGLGQTCTKAAK